MLCQFISNRDQIRWKKQKLPACFTISSHILSGFRWLFLHHVTKLLTSHCVQCIMGLDRGVKCTWYVEACNCEVIIAVQSSEVPSLQFRCLSADVPGDVWKTLSLSLGGMEIDCQPEESMVSSFDEDCVVLGDVKDMRLEAEAVVNDVLFAVSEMHVSQSLNSASDVAYINVETREGNRYCLELTEAGLRVRCSN